MTPVLKKFYKLFWSDEACRSIFLMHKEQLLEKVEINADPIKTVYYLPRFVLSNSKERAEAAIVLKDRLGSRHIDIDYDMQALMTRNLDEEKVEQYLNLHVLKPFKKIINKFKEDDGIGIRFLVEFLAASSSEKRMLKFLRKYEVIDESITSYKEIENRITSFVEDQAKTLLKNEAVRDIIFGLDGVAAYYSNSVFESLMDANKVQTDRLFNDENYKDRNKLFDQLYEKQVITSGKYLTYYECVECDEGVFSGSVRLKVRPSKVKLHCPNCNQEVLYLAPYEICGELFELIKSDDGVIIGALGSCLDYLKIKHQTGLKQEPDIEIDLVILDKEDQICGIVECKMFKTDRPVDTQVGNLRQALGQIKKMREKLGKIDEGYLEIDYFLVTNIGDPDVYAQFQKECKKDIKAINLTVCDVVKFRDMAEEWEL